MGIGDIWNLIAVQPVINVLIVLTDVLFNNFGLAIIALTLIVNGAMLPLTLKQVRASKAMQELQPKLAELKKKYGKDKEKMAREQMRLYKESGVSPAGCLLPLLIQMPVWIALFQSIMRMLAIIPENLAGLSQYLYSWPMVYSTLPLNNHFLWLNLGSGDIFLAILVGASMWVQQKMVQAPVADPSQKTQSSLMLWILPIMFAWLTLSFPSGLVLFWVTSNLFRIGMQYWIGGWGGLRGSAPKKDTGRDKKYKKRIAEVEETPEGGADIVPSPAQEEEVRHEKSRSKWEHDRASRTKSTKKTKPKRRRS